MHIETHCHLDYLKKCSASEAITLARQESVEKIITISVSPNNLDTVIEIAQKNNNVFCTQGIHPHDAKEFNSEVLEKIEQNTVNNLKVVAIGEIGLDYHYHNSAKDLQITAFEQQLELACKLDKPVVIHTREAEQDTEQILTSICSRLKRKGVLHSYTSNQKLADFAIDQGFYLGFNGIITFKNAQDVRDRVQSCPLEQILVETDSPYLSPAPHRGKENGPFRIPLIVEKIAEIKNQPITEVAKQLTLNAQKLFSL